jgi:hypothetical protein
LTQSAIYRSTAKPEAILPAIVIVSLAEITRVGAAASPLWPADDLKGNSMERVERVEDLDMPVLRTQGIVGVDGIIPMSTA